MLGEGLYTTHISIARQQRNVKPDRILAPFAGNLQQWICNYQMFRDLSEPCWSLAEHICIFYLCTCNCNLTYSMSTALPSIIWPSLGLTKTIQGRWIKMTLLFFWHSVWSPDLCPLSDEVKTFFHPKMLDTWQWLMARTTQLAHLFPLRLPAASLEPCCDESWQLVLQLHCTWKPRPWQMSQHLLHRSKQCPSASEPRGKSCSFYSVHMYSTSTIILRQCHVPAGIKLQRDWCISQQGGLKIKLNSNRGQIKQRGRVIAILWDCKAHTLVKLQKPWI